MQQRSVGHNWPWTCDKRVRFDARQELGLEQHVLETEPLKRIALDHLDAVIEKLIEAGAAFQIGQPYDQWRLRHNLAGGDAIDQMLWEPAY